MGTKRRRLLRYARPPTDPAVWAWLTDAEPPTGSNPFALMALRDDDLRELWHEHRERILADHIDVHPGTRPAAWWLWDAPRALPVTLGRFYGTTFAPAMVEPRCLLRGSGCPLHEAAAFAPSYAYGIPAWCGDPDEPPEFETQAAYLKRHGLLLPAERRARPVEPHPYPLHIEPMVA
jgi:hypothetical protein